jgi:hypothetical protein
MSEAMRRASLDTIQMLFSRGGNIAYGQLLHNAVLRQDSDTQLLVDYLLCQGAWASINEIQYQHYPQAFAERFPFALGTPLHYAVELGHEDLVVFLISCGADLTIRNTSGMTVLEIANTPKMVKMLQILQKHPQNT